MDKNETTPIPPAGGHVASPLRKAAVDIFLISFVILFLELACIRWFPAHVLFLTFFTNMILLACFLGMSLGCLAARHLRSYIKSTPFLLLVALVAGNAVELLRDQFEKVLDVGHQASPQQVYFGTESSSLQGADRFVIPIELLGAFFFVLITLTMVGPGQELGRALTRLPNRVYAYTVNIVGSIAGIVLFWLMSLLRLSPGWWFALVTLGLAYFLFDARVRLRSVVARVGLLAMIVVMAAATGFMTSSSLKQEIWSPYSRIDYYPPNKDIRVNLIAHQRMHSRTAKWLAYPLPHMMNRDAGGRPFKEVLIIGAGSGNDVSYALQWGAQHIDAVEIDPVIPVLGGLYHPDAPYADARVTVYQGDGRAFLRSTDKQYDLIVFALIDSLVLHSGYSNIRLESYLFTKEAFADVKRCLKPNGVLVMSNFFRQGWIVARLQKTLTEVFETPPIVFTVPYLGTVEPEQFWNGFTFFIAGRAPALERFREAFHLRGSEPIEREFYWTDGTRAPDPSSPNGFEQRPLPSEVNKKWAALGVASVHEPPVLDIATDDWPFLYLRSPMIPDISLRGAAIMGGIALVLLLWFGRRQQTVVGAGDAMASKVKVRRKQKMNLPGLRAPLFDGRMFFLGAGFMLIETKAVVHMALLFGSTWMVNSVVFVAVLVMILLANLLVATVRPQLLWPYYLGLFVALMLNVIIPLNSFLEWRSELRTVGSCVLVFAPILFAAVIFAVSFSRTREADRAFGFNIAGAMAGGLAEYSSMLLGFRYLLLVAMGFYALSSLWRSNRDVPMSALTAVESNP